VSDGLHPVDGKVLDHVAEALRELSRFTNGVLRDRPFRYLPHRAWVYREPATFDSELDSGLVEIAQRIGIEACFPVSVDDDGQSDLEAEGGTILAEIELAVFQQPERGVNAVTKVLAHNAHLLPREANPSSGGAVHARAIMLIECTYSRGYGNPYAQAASWPGQEA